MGGGTLRSKSSRRDTRTRPDARLRRPREALELEREEEEREEERVPAGRTRRVQAAAGNAQEVRVSARLGASPPNGGAAESPPVFWPRVYRPVACRPLGDRRYASCFHCKILLFAILTIKVIHIPHGKYRDYGKL